MSARMTPNNQFQRSVNSRPLNWGVRRLVAVLAVGGFPECRRSWLIPSLQMRRKALSLSEGYVLREQVGSSKLDSPAPAETSSPYHSLAGGASRMAETGTRGGSGGRWYPGLACAAE
jgi:hypothetical protein